MDRLSAQTTASASRKAFTLIETLAVIGIISLLMGILVPAIQSARDSARRTDCLNRLRQLGFALLEYEESYGVLPPAVTCESTDSASVRSISAQVAVLPFLDQKNVYERILSAKRISMLDLKEFQLPVLHCPSERNHIGLSYRACSGSGPGLTETDRGLAKSEAGAFSVECRGIPLSAMTDGLSNTVGMSERSISDGFSGTFKPSRDIWYSSALHLGFDPLASGSSNFREICNSVRTNGPGPHYTPFAGHNFLEAGFVHTAYNHVLPPNAPDLDCILALDSDGNPASTSTLSASWGIVGARSEHRDGSVSVLYLDGAVRLANPSIDLRVWGAAASRSGEETDL